MRRATASVFSGLLPSLSKLSPLLLLLLLPPDTAPGIGCHGGVPKPYDDGELGVGGGAARPEPSILGSMEGERGEVVGRGDGDSVSEGTSSSSQESATGAAFLPLDLPFGAVEGVLRDRSDIARVGMVGRLGSLMGVLVAGVGPPWI